jgi:hypothetical protein
MVYFLPVGIKYLYGPKPHNPEGSKNKTADNYDTTEETCKRSSQMIILGWQGSWKKDDVNEETTRGTISTPRGDNWAENKMSTSLDDEP